MKKTIVMFAILLFANFEAFALDGVCIIKEKNAAAYEFAQAAGIPVQEVSIVDFKPGEWTNNAADNTGSDKVTVIGNRPNRGPTQATYTIYAKQVGSFQICDIVSVQ